MGSFALKQAFYISQEHAVRFSWGSTTVCPSTAGRPFGKNYATVSNCQESRIFKSFIGKGNSTDAHQWVEMHFNFDSDQNVKAQKCN